ncbi:MAG: SRPBCC domain-containing protein [Nitrososphaerota archaeon]|nr:SRPBCC domain-containing protein [Nitrososphaerota archaeon]
MEVDTEIEIDASAEVVWGILTDFASYPEWNPFILKVAGELSPGKKLQTLTKEGDGSPTVLRVEESREIRLWNRFAEGLDGEHILAIERLGPERVRFRHDFHYRGSAVGKFARELESSSRRDAGAMNLALKKRSEMRKYSDRSLSSRAE